VSPNEGEGRDAAGPEQLQLKEWIRTFMNCLNSKGG